MISFPTEIQVAKVNVMTSDEGGHSTEQIVELAMDRILKVSETAPPAIKEQAEAFQNNIRQVLYDYMELARREERGTIAQRMAKSGHNEIADLVRRI
jgi:BMFP domain-containing protein YqiC